MNYIIEIDGNVLRPLNINIEQNINNNNLYYNQHTTQYANQIEYNISLVFGGDINYDIIDILLIYYQMVMIWLYTQVILLINHLEIE